MIRHELAGILCVLGFKGLGSSRMNDIINIGLAFLEGLALIVSPCILPILPIILSASIEGNLKRPFGIIIGFVFTFSLFTYFSRELVQHTGIDLNIVRNASFILLIVFGIIMLSSYLTEMFSRLTKCFSNIGLSLTSEKAQSGFSVGILFGGIIGLVWTPCAGPILAAVIVQTVISKTTLSGFLIILAFGIGAAVPMLVIALMGNRIMLKLTFFKKRGAIIRKLLGVIIIGSVLWMIYGAGYLLPQEQSVQVGSSGGLTLQQGLRQPYVAPPITGIQAWINSNPLQLEQLKGKVILIDFWAYSCINCIRTLPYLLNWYKKYHDKGLIIIGVHSPEFDFERDYNNVQNAIRQYGIQYPVALDNQFATWQNYNNHYWPAHYLIDKDGRVVYEHFGEGDYDITENNVRYLLGINSLVQNVSKENINFHQTPETYLGYERERMYRSPENIVNDQTSSYTYPKELSENTWALKEKWQVSSEKITSKENGASIKIHFYSRKVFAVLGSADNRPIKVKVLLDGEPLSVGSGKDIKQRELVVTNHKLYTLVELQHPSGGILELVSQSPGLEMYTFTFGE